MAAAEHELTGHRWHPSVSADRHEYVARDRLLFAVERDLHAGALEAGRLPALRRHTPAARPRHAECGCPAQEVPAREPDYGVPPVGCQ